MTKDELKQQVYQAIEQRGDEIIGLGEEIRRHPELGFKEVKTARLVEETFKKLGLAPRSGLAMTGVRAEVAGRGGEGPTFAVLGGDGDRIAHAELVEFRGDDLVAHALGLVHDEDRFRAALAQLLRDALVLRGQARAPVGNEEHDVGFGDRLARLARHLRHDAFLGDRLGIGCGKINQPRFRCFMIMGRDIAEASGRMAAN